MRHLVGNGGIEPLNSEPSTILLKEKVFTEPLWRRFPKFVEVEGIEPPKHPYAIF